MLGSSVWGKAAREEEASHSERVPLASSFGGQDPDTGRSETGISETSRLAGADNRRKANVWGRFVQEGAADRLLLLQQQFPMLPPEFQMPMPTDNAWATLLAGPEKWSMAQTRVKGADVQNVFKNKRRLSDPERFEEERESDRCMEEMQKRESKSTFTRQFGCQTLILSAVVMVTIYHTFAGKTGRRATILWRAFCSLWSSCALIFCCSWSKAVTRISGVVFQWFAQTYTFVLHSGDQIAMNVRRQILTRVLGMLHCREEDLYDLAERLEWDQFRPRLSKAHGLFPEARINTKDDTVESNCMFLDEAGVPHRFIWKILGESDSGAFDSQRGERGPETLIRNYAGDKEFPLKEGPEPWKSRTIPWIRDIQSDEVTAIVKSHPWWEKLEFQLRAEQHKVIGFRVYLGELFNSGTRFKLWAGFIPILFVFLAMAAHINYVNSDYFIVCDLFQLIPHIVASICFGITINFCALWWNHPRNIARCLRFALEVLTKQVQKDWMLIMKLPDSEAFPMCSNGFDDSGTNPIAPATDLYAQQKQQPRTIDQYNEIPLLWQVLTCDDSIHDIAVQVSDAFFLGGAMTRTRREAQMWTDENLVKPLQSIF